MEKETGTKAMTGASSSGTSPGRTAIAVVCAGLLLTVLFLGSMLLQRTAPVGAASAGHIADRLFNPTTIWTVRLNFAPDQWETMEPKGGMGPFGGPPGGPGPFGGPPGGPNRITMAGFPSKSFTPWETVGLRPGTQTTRES
jgi:hypothetical protein